MALFVRPPPSLLIRPNLRADAVDAECRRSDRQDLLGRTASPDKMGLLETMARMVPLALHLHHNDNNTLAVRNAHKRKRDRQVDQARKDCQEEPELQAKRPTVDCADLLDRPDLLEDPDLMVNPEVVEKPEDQALSELFLDGPDHQARKEHLDHAAPPDLVEAQARTDKQARPVQKATMEPVDNQAKAVQMDNPVLKETKVTAAVAIIVHLRVQLPAIKLFLEVRHSTPFVGFNFAFFHVFCS